MPIVNPDPLRYPGTADTTGGASAPTGADTSSASSWLQQQPWYRSTLASWGNPQTLSLGQRGYLARTAQQSGMNSSFGIGADGRVEDWSTPLGVKIALAAFAAAASGAELGLFGGGGSSAAGGSTGLAGTAPTLEATMNAEKAGSIPSAFGMNAVDTIASGPPGGAGLTDWLKAAKNTGDALSAMSSGRAQGRLGESLANQAQNRTAVDLYNTELNAPRTIARNAVKGDVLANAQDVSFDNVPSTIPVPTISGGLRPSMFSDATRQTGRNISQAAANTPIPSPTAPILPPLPDAGGLDAFLNGASGVAGLASATAPLWRKYL